MLKRQQHIPNYCQCQYHGVNICLEAAECGFLSSCLRVGQYLNMHELGRRHVLLEPIAARALNAAVPIRVDQWFETVNLLRQMLDV